MIPSSVSASKAGRTLPASPNINSANGCVNRREQCRVAKMQRFPIYPDRGNHGLSHMPNMLKAARIQKAGLVLGTNVVWLKNASHDLACST